MSDTDVAKLLDFNAELRQCRAMVDGGMTPTGYRVIGVCDLPTGHNGNHEGWYHYRKWGGRMRGAWPEK